MLNYRMLKKKYHTESDFENNCTIQFCFFDVTAIDFRSVLHKFSKTTIFQKARRSTRLIMHVRFPFHSKYRVKDCELYLHIFFKLHHMIISINLKNISYNYTFNVVSDADNSSGIKKRKKIIFNL